MQSTALLCTAILGAMLFGLGPVVSGLRGKYKRLIGVPDDPDHPLYRLVRAHGNTAEFAPFLAVLFLYLGSHSQAPWVQHTIIAATVCRVLLVVGMVFVGSMTRPNPVRFVGALGTYLTGLALCWAAATGA